MSSCHQGTQSTRRQESNRCERKMDFLRIQFNQMMKENHFSELINMNVKGLDDELIRDQKLVDKLFEMGRINFEPSVNDIDTELGNVIHTSSKSSFNSRKSLQMAQDYMAIGRYIFAIPLLTKAIEYAPQKTDDDMKFLALLYLKRQECSFQVSSNNIDDIYFAFQAHPKYCIETLKSIPEFVTYSRMFDNISKNSGSIIEMPEIKPIWISPHIKIDKKDKNRDEYVITNLIQFEKDESIVAELPFVYYSSNGRKICPNCNVTLNGTHFWPCKFCIDFGYCSKICCEKNYCLHKYECGLFQYLQHYPMLMMMLRFYFKADATPLSQHISGSVVEEYVNSVVGQQQESTQQQQMKVKINKLAVEAFRSTMDKTAKRFQTLEDNETFALLMLAIELFCIYDYCLFNATRLDDLTIIDNYDSHHSAMSNSKKLFGYRKSFNWLPNNVSTTHAIALVLRDAKRFLKCEMIKCAPPYCEVMQESDEKRDRYLYIFSGILYPTLFSSKVHFRKNVEKHHDFDNKKLMLRVSKACLISGSICQVGVKKKKPNNNNINNKEFRNNNKFFNRKASNLEYNNQYQNNNKIK